MKKFSRETKTEKDKLLESFSAESGLPIDACNNLYESLGKELFLKKSKELLKVGLVNFDTSIRTLLDILKNTGQESLNDFLISFLGETAKNDSLSFFKVLLYLLFMKDQTNFSKLAQNMDIDAKLAGFIKTKAVNLFESVGLPSDCFETVKENNVPVITGFNQGTALQDDLEFYGNLKQLLARNNKRWGNNYHLTNVYEAIMKYIEYEAEYIQHKDSMYHVDGNFEDDLIKQLFLGQLPVMYRDVNVLRNIIADIQTLTFDMICLFMGFVKSNQQFMKYMNRDVTNRFITSFSAVYGKLISSKKTSHVLKSSNVCCSDSQVTRLTQIFDDCWLKADYSFYNHPMDLRGAVDILYIIKSCSQDFEIRIRPYLREFVTAGFEYLAKYESIYAEINKTNKYKNLIIQ